jgi:hypothetical protein
VKIPPETDLSRSFDRPPVQLGGVTATGSYDAMGRRVPIVLKEGALVEGVEVSASFTLDFDRFLLPDKIGRQSICLQAGDAAVTKIEECTNPGQSFTLPEYQPARRRVVYRLEKDVRLKADTKYRLTVFVVPSATAGGPLGFFAFDGAPLARSYSFDFVTKSDTKTARNEPRPSRERFCDIVKCVAECATCPMGACACKSQCPQWCGSGDTACIASCEADCAKDTDTCKKRCNCLDGDRCQDGGLLAKPKSEMFDQCAFAGCHAAGNEMKPPPMGLDLDARIAETALNVTAHGTQTGEGAAADLSGARFGRSMPLVHSDGSVGDPGKSYVMYKMMINFLNFDATQQQTNLREEIGRLRKGAIVGIPMPRNLSTGTVAPLFVDAGSGLPDGVKSQAKMQLISDWIAHGAVLKCQ